MLIGCQNIIPQHQPTLGDGIVRPVLWDSSHLLRLEIRRHILQDIILFLPAVCLLPQQLRRLLGQRRLHRPRHLRLGQRRLRRQLQRPCMTARQRLLLRELLRRLLQDIAHMFGMTPLVGRVPQQVAARLAIRALLNPDKKVHLMDMKLIFHAFDFNS